MGAAARDRAGGDPTRRGRVGGGEVSEPLSSRAWVQWKTEFDLAPGRHEIAVRATDGTGEVQTELKASPRPDGASGHHRITVDAV